VYSGHITNACVAKGLKQLIVGMICTCRVGIDGGKPENFLVTGLGFPPSGLKLIIPGGKHNVPVSAQLRDGSKYEMHIAVFIITTELSMTINYSHSLTDSTQLIDHRLY
jgi:hypothetical protein